MVIPEAAVEAAADIVRQAQWGYLTPERAVRYILEAAAPHMLEDAWDAGAEAMERSTWPDGDMPANPYRSAE